MPESLTVSVDASGTVSPDAPGFLYTRSQTQVSVRHVAEDGTVLSVEEAVLQSGESRTFTAGNFSGYTLQAGSESSITVTVQEDGSISPASPVFLYTRNRTAVTIQSVADDGTVLNVLSTAVFMMTLQLSIRLCEMASGQQSRQVPERSCRTQLIICLLP